MELKNIFKLFVKWLWLIVLVPAVAGGIVYYMNVYKAIPSYEATATLFIINDQNDMRVSAIYGDITSGQSTVKNYSSIVKSKAMLGEALDKLNIKDVDINRISQNVSLVFDDKYSFVLGLKVKDDDPVLAMDLANELSRLFEIKIEGLTEKNIVELLDDASLPTVPVSNKATKELVLAVAAGLCAALSLVLIVEFVNSSKIKNAEDVKKFINLEVLGLIPEIHYQNHII